MLSKLGRRHKAGDVADAVAGAREGVFTERAIDLIAEQSRGVPRVINIIADTALVYAFSAQEERVEAEIVQLLGEHLSINCKSTVLAEDDERWAWSG